MNVWSIRHQGSPDPVDGISAEEIVDGVKEGIWEPTDEVMGPNDPDWVSLEEHPVFAQAMADYEPPPPKHYPDETKLDMNPLIDVALVLLIFFMLTTTYEQMRREFEPGKGVRDNKKGQRHRAATKVARGACLLHSGKRQARLSGRGRGGPRIRTRSKVQGIQGKDREQQAGDGDRAASAMENSRGHSGRGIRGQVRRDHSRDATAKGIAANALAA